MSRLTDWQSKAKQAAATVRAEYEAGKRGDDTPAAPIWATPQQQLDGLLAVFRNRADPESTVPAYPPRGFFGQWLNPYTARATSAPNMTNSSRLESLLRAGNLYLSLQDAIALALENNLDLQLQRYGAQVSDLQMMVQ